MDQHKLYRTIQILGEAEFRTEEQLIAHVLEQIIKNEDIPIRGARIWRLETSTGTYRLARQYGEMDSIDKNFRIRVLDYPLFLRLLAGLDKELSLVIEHVKPDDVPRARDFVRSQFDKI